MLVFSCLFLSTVVVHGELVDRIVAIVNDEAITLSELEETVAPYEEKIRNSFYRPDEERHMLFKVRQDMLDQMIDQELTDQESKRLGVSVHDTEVDRRIEQIKAENFLSETELIRALKNEGHSLEEYRQKVKSQLLRIKLINLEVKSKIAVTENDIKEYYEDHKDAFGEKTKYHIRTILIRVPSWEKAEDRTNGLKKVETVMNGLEAGIPFPELAQQYSEDLSAKNGGDLGLFSIQELAPELRETVRWMKEGEVSPALQAAQGYQILMLEEIRSASGRALKEARLEIQERMFRGMAEEKYKEWLEALRERSFIKVVP